MRFFFEKRTDSTPLGHTTTIIGAVVLALVFGEAVGAQERVPPLSMPTTCCAVEQLWLPKA